MKQGMAHLLKDERGTSAVEYGFICAMIVIGLISAVRGVADENTGLWATVSSKQQEATEKAIS